MPLPYKYITVEGNIGSGKTSLATKLAQDLNGSLVLEQFADNPFLPQFYENPQRYAFALELFFMAERFQQLKESTSSQTLFSQLTVSDYLFIKSLLFARVTLNEEEYKLYQRLFNIIYSNLPEPELLVYLHCEVPQLLKNIAKRGRDYEQKIPGSYLSQIQDTYFSYLKSNTHLRIVVLDVTQFDFVNDADNYARIKEILSRDYKPGIHYPSLSESPASFSL
jgi:deoxyguanosine kinase